MFIENFLLPLLERGHSSQPAFIIQGKTFSYSDFIGVVGRIEHQIADIEDRYVGIYANDSIETYASIIGLWLLGKAYIPLNPNQPIKRHMEILDDIDAHFVLSSDASYSLPKPNVNIIITSPDGANNYEPQKAAWVEDVCDDIDAYVLFTSGSTGKPKGVRISRGNLTAFLFSMDNIGLSITSEDRCLQPFDLTFDFSVSSYLLPLSKGASAYTIPEHSIKFIYIAKLLTAYQLTVLQMVPSMIRALLPYIQDLDLSSIRYNILCGEALQSSIIQAWHSGIPSMVSYNMYGPTENTVFCSYYLISNTNINNLLSLNGVVSIGEPYPYNSLKLFDENGKLITSDNKQGELCLSGPQLSPGYWNNPKENNQKFFIYEGERYYRTGDICQYSGSGELLYVCRKDFQVKINGFRVELGEIENNYYTISKGRLSVVLPFTNEQGHTELAIIIEGDSYNYQTDKTALTAILPPYEIPSKWIFIPSLPLNSNGKIDRAKIREITHLNY